MQSRVQKVLLFSFLIGVFPASFELHASEKTECYQSLVSRIATEYKVSPNLVMAIIEAESRGDAAAVSSQGALGVMQLMPSTAHKFGVVDPFDPEENITGGVRYLRYLMGFFGQNLKLVLSAYHVGHNKVRRNMEMPTNVVTQGYVHQVLSLYNELQKRQTPVASVSDWRVEWF